MSTLRLPAHYYQQFDAEFARDVPGEGYGGWQQADIDISREHTAVVVMHAWDAGRRAEFPGWHRAVEYIPRSYAICQTVFPPLLQAVRAAGFKLIHVVGGGDYFRACPGYQKAQALAGPSPAGPAAIAVDETLAKLQAFRADHVFVGAHNRADVQAGFKRLDFAPQARPQGDEWVVGDTHQMAAVCRHLNVNHLIYAGFAINWCLLLSPGGMAEVSKYGIMCSAFRQAVTAVENRETARAELAKELGLWRVALAYGFVFDVDPFVAALRQRPAGG